MIPFLVSTLIGALLAGYPLAGVFLTSREGPRWLDLLTLFPFVASGLGMVALGLGYLIQPRATIQLDRSRLRVRERLGPFGWTWAVPRSSLQAFRVRAFPSSRAREAVAVIEARVRNRWDPFTLGRGYPVGCLEAVARTLSEAHGDALMEATVRETPGHPDGAVKRPEDGTFALEYTADSVRLTDPPKGVWKAGGCVLIGSILWILASLLIGTWALEDQAPEEQPVVAGFVLAFVLIGIGFLLAALRIGLAETVIELTEETLVLIRRGLLGSWLRQWPRTEIAAFSTRGGDGFLVSEYPRGRLLVELKGGRTFRLLRGRPLDELEWIAAVLGEGPRKRAGSTPP